MPRAVRLLRLSARLGAVAAGSVDADHAIHDALGWVGEPPPYSTDIAAARTLIPEGFEECPSISAAGGMIHAAVR